ncbi:MAG: serine hydrolase domain-containing protein [Pseudomonadota bacterium]
MRFSLLLLLYCWPLLAGANVLYRQDFEGDSALGWREAGSGTIQFTEYAGNTTLRLSKRKAATLRLSTAGYEDIRVSMQLAGGGLGRRDACHAELSVDGGETWRTVIEVRDGRDDAVTLYYGRADEPALSNNPKLELRFRAAGRGNSAYCWGDNVTVEGRPAGAAASEPRLTTEFLFSSEPLQGPVDYTAFVGREAADTDPREFRLSLMPRAGSGLRTVLDRFDYEAAGGPALRSFPAIDIELLQAGGKLIPADQGILSTQSLLWEIGFQPGTAWRDSAAGADRFALPFALFEKNANCTHNGVLSWARRDDGTLSRAAFQIASETCPYFKFDMWGMLDIEIADAEIESAPALLRAFEKHRDSRIPVRDIAQLGEAYPDVDTAGFGSLAGMNPDDMSVYGLLVDGIHYRGGCATRYGRYPFCDALLLPSYSTAKSIFAGLALMRLEKLAPGAASLKIAELVPECDSEDWRDVSIENAVDMASGNYDSAVYDEDESAPAHIEFLYAASHEERIRSACRNYPRKAEPGTRWVYRSSDTYVAGTAIRAALARQLGHDADIYDELLVQPILKPLEVSPVLRETRTSYDERQQPLAGWGLTLLADDALKVADWLNTGDGLLDGEKMLDNALYRGAMQRSENDRGLEALGPDTRYNNGFWSLDIRSFIGCEQPVHVPFMSGHGGIVIVMFPNDTVYYYFSDGYRFRWREAAVEANKIRSMCP